MIERLQLVNFRSYAEREFELSPKVTLVVGPNASGKTNLLEAIFVAAATKSFRAPDAKLIRHGTDFFKVAVEGHGRDHTLVYKLTPEGSSEKKARLNGRNRPLSEYVGSLKAVLFEPNDLIMASGEPIKRRKYLDFVLCQTDQTYLKQLLRYRKILKQRNSLLESFSVGSLKDQIFAWDLQLAEAALEIYRRRRGLIEHINQTADRLYEELSGHRAGLRLEYLPSVLAGSKESPDISPDAYAAGFMDSLASNLTSDLAAGFTTVGPHREDFKVKFGEQDLPAVASRGETRTATLVLKLAELAYIEKESEAKPLLLLDDVFSELDHSRKQFLLAKMSGHQTIITATEAPHLGSIKDPTIIETTPSKPIPTKKLKARARPAGASSA